MSNDSAYVEAWLRRIGYQGPRVPTLETLRAIILAQATTIPFENIDVLLGRPPKLDPSSLHQKMIAVGRGGYCFEQNLLLRSGLLALGFKVTGLIGRVVRGMDADAPRPAGHMMLRVDLPEGEFLADTGFGNLTPTAPIAMRREIEQATPHETMRLLAMGEEFLLQAKIEQHWENLYRLSLHPRLDADYEVANWFTATHPNSPFVSHLIAARAGPGGARYSLFNGRLSVRHTPDQVERRLLDSEAEYEGALAGTFGLSLSAADLTALMETLDRKGTRGATHPFFA
jgi:N-hydroxyarylamine O-acetyltransferase